MSECTHDPRFDGDDVVCSKCGERRDAITGATIPSAPAVTDQQSAEVETSRNEVEALDLRSLALMAENEITRIYDRVAPGTYDKYAKPIDLLLAEGVRALTQRIETLTRERDEAYMLLGAFRPTLERAEAQRDRLAEELREADNGLAKIERQNYTGTWREIVEQHSRAAGEIRDRIVALSEIEQAASNEECQHERTFQVALIRKADGEHTIGFEYPVEEGTTVVETASYCTQCRLRLEDDPSKRFPEDLPR